MDADAWIGKIVGNDVPGVAAALAAEPELVALRDPHIGSTALHFAAHRGFADIVAALLAAGADPHAREETSDTTPLHWAAEGGHAGVARQLLERGADLEARDRWFGLSPLGWATLVTWAPQLHHDRAGATAFLLAAGARHDAFTAIAIGSPEALRAVVAADAGALERRLGFVETDKRPLHVAIERGDPELVAVLVALGADVAARTAWGLTPLALALRSGDAETIALLRAAGARDDRATAMVTGDVATLAAELGADRSAGDSPTPLLFAAARHGLADAIGVMVHLGASVNARMRHLVGEVLEQVSPLHLAAQHGHVAAVRALLDAGAAPSPGVDDGAPTPLHLAAAAGHADVVELLLSRGADVAARDRGFRSTALEWAEHGGHAGVIALLKSWATPVAPSDAPDT